MKACFREKADSGNSSFVARKKNRFRVGRSKRKPSETLSNKRYLSDSKPLSQLACLPRSVTMKSAAETPSGRSFNAAI